MGCGSMGRGLIVGRWVVEQWIVGLWDRRGVMGIADM